MELITKILTKYLKVFIFFYMLGFLLAIVLFFTLPKKYKATAEIMPSLEEELLTTIGSALTNFNPLMSMMVTPADIYAKIIQSRAVMYEVMDSLNLYKKFKSKSKIKLYRKLIKSIEIKPYAEGIIEISYEDRDKEFAAKMVNTVVKALDDVNRKTVMTKGKELRIFLEGRLKEEKALIDSLRDSLKTFQAKYNTILPVDEYASLVTGYFGLYKEYMMEEAKLEYMTKIYSEDNPLVQTQAKMVETYEKQLRTYLRADDSTKNAKMIFNVSHREIPEVIATYLDLKLKLEAHEEVYKFLFSKYEEAKLMEQKDTPTFTVMKLAEVPDYKSSPRGTHLVLIFFFISTLVNLTILIIGEVPEAREILKLIFKF